MPAWNQILEEFQKSINERHGPPDADGIRRKYLAKLFAKTGRNVILYATRFTTPGPDVPQPLLSINDEDMTGLMTVIHGMRGKQLDLILHLPGGGLEATESFVEYLRSKFTNIRVIVPQLALSAATMLACSGDVVALGKHSFLGPIDPQILIRSPVGGQMIFVPAQAIKDQFDKAVIECRDPKKLPAWIPMLQQYGPHLLITCDDVSSVSESLVTDWLKRWMFKKDRDKDTKAKKIAAWLANHGEWKTHGRHIPRRRLEQMGLRVEHLEQDSEFQDAVLSVFHATLHTFGFSPAAKIIENHLGNAFVKVWQMPMMLPPGLQLAPAPPPGQFRPIVPPAQPPSQP